MQKKYTSTILFFACLFFFTGCGRKQRNILCFPVESQLNISKLDLPTVKGIKAQTTNIGIYVSWLPLFTEKTPASVKRFEYNFMGFDLFRLENNAKFIPKTPINEKPITTNYFLDKLSKNSQKAAYTIQPLFKFENRILHGPSSQIIKVNKYETLLKN